MELGVQLSISLQIRKVAYNVAGKDILHNISMSVAPGELAAVMGPSGSGKTTLLKIVGGRLTPSSGEVTYNKNNDVNPIRKRIGFVDQEDVLFPHLTVRESLVYTALLRLSNKLTYKEKIHKADQAVEELGLQRCKNTIVGGSGIRGVSGGERKRVSIGCELLVDPLVLLLDEPTSGLDSTTALKIVRLIQAIAASGRTVVTTIHQPSSRLFHMFHKLVLISEGYTIFAGQAVDSVAYFERLGLQPRIAMNPADFLLDLAAGEFDDTSVTATDISNLRSDVSIAIPEAENNASRQATHTTTAQNLEYLRRMYEKELEPEVLLPANEFGEGLGYLPITAHYPLPWGSQFIILVARTFKVRSRDYFDWTKFVTSIGTPLLLGLLWWQSNVKSSAALKDQVGLLFYIVVSISSSIFGSMMVFPMESRFLVKDLAADMYQLSAFYASSTLCEAVGEIFHSTIFILVVYFMTGLRRRLSSFFLTLLTTWLLCVVSQGAGDVFGAATMDVRKAAAIASMAYLCSMLVGGYYVQHVPRFLQEWIKYIAPAYFGYDILRQIQYHGDLKINCNNHGTCQALSDEPALHGVNLHGGVRQVCVLLAMAVVYRVIAYLFLLQVRKNTTHT